MWPNGAKCAVSIAYIGGHTDHVDLAVPLLRNLSMPATFYVDPVSILVNANQWSSLTHSEHEIGIAPFETAEQSGELPYWEPKGIRDEIRSSKKFVREFFKTEAKGIAHKGEKLIAGSKDCTVMLTDAFDHVLSGHIGLNDGFTPPHHLSSLPIKNYPSGVLSDAIVSQRLTWVVIPFRRIFVNNETLLVHRMILEAVNRVRTNLYIAPVSQVAHQLSQIQATRDVEML
jgi:hypothetical protein